MTRVAIIGAGISGCGLANFLKEDLDPSAEIEIFEKDDRIGGRLQRVEFAGRMIDTGGTVIHAKNLYALELTQRLGLYLGSNYPTSEADPSGTGTWNGHSWVHRSSPDCWAQGPALLRDYRFSLIQAKKFLQAFEDRFKQIYPLQAEGMPFSSAEDLLEHLELRNTTRESAGDRLETGLMSRSFVDKVAVPITRAHYGQGKEVNSFTMAVSLAGCGLAGPFFGLRRGTQALCSETIRQLEIPVHLNTEIKVIKKAGDFFLRSSSEEFGPFTHVVWAAPMPAVPPQVTGDLNPLSPTMAQDFQTTHVTLVEGRLNPAYFGEKSLSDLPEDILTTDEDSLPFSSISHIVTSKNRPEDPSWSIYKIFSRNVMEEETLNQLFGERGELKRMAWKAYPKQLPREFLPKFELDSSFYYCGALEAAASCIEIQLIAAKNIANLIRENVSEVQSA